MIKKRIEPLVYTKEQLKEFLYEILEKGNYIYSDKENIAFSDDFYYEINGRKTKIS